MSNEESHPTSNSLLLEVEGMKCAGCVRSVEQTLLALPNISTATVNLVTRTALLHLEDPNQSIEPILQALADRGFPSSERSKSFFTEKNLLKE